METLNVVITVTDDSTQQLSGPIYRSQTPAMFTSPLSNTRGPYGIGGMVSIYNNFNGDLIVRSRVAGLQIRRSNVTVTVLKKKSAKFQMKQLLLSGTDVIQNTWTSARSKDLKSLSRSRLHASIDIDFHTITGQLESTFYCTVLHSFLFPKPKRTKLIVAETHLWVLELNISPRNKLDFKIVGNIDMQLETPDKTALTVTAVDKNKKFRICRRKFTTNVASEGSCGSVTFDKLSHLTALELKAVLKLESEENVQEYDGFMTSLPAKSTLHSKGRWFVLSSELPYFSAAAHFYKMTNCQLQYTIIVGGNFQYSNLTWSASLHTTTSNNSARIVEELGTTKGTVLQGTSASPPISYNLFSVIINTAAGIYSSEVSLPNLCGPSNGVKKEEKSIEIQFNPDDLTLPTEQLANIPAASSTSNTLCMFGGHYYQEAEIWIPRSEPCVTCSCNMGSASCLPVACPVPKCHNPVIIENDCCLQCVDYLPEAPPQSNYCYFKGDKRYHRFGTVFHPFVTPFGYQKCALCSCLNENEVICSRTPCPILNCPEEEAVRDEVDTCCKRCPDSISPAWDTNIDFGFSNPADDNNELPPSPTACRFHDMVYDDGSEWNPRVAPFGVLPCVHCHCKNGVHHCQRKQCPDLQCDKLLQIKRPGTCCAQCI